MIIEVNPEEAITTINGIKQWPSKTEW